MSSFQYLKALHAARDLLDQVERKLSEGNHHGVVIDEWKLRELAGSGVFSVELAVVILAGLTEIGVLREEEGKLRLDGARLKETEAFRQGVRLGIDAVGNRESAIARVVCSVSEGIDQGLLHDVRLEAADIEAAVRDVVASAQDSVLLASPYWDIETAGALGELVGKRLKAGLRVSILGRTANPNTARGRPLADLLDRYSAFDGFEVYTWYEPSEYDEWGRTFHFKVAVADAGKKVYLGTANFTTAAFRSRFEVGVVLTGEAGASVSRIMDLTLSLAQRAMVGTDRRHELT